MFGLQDQRNSADIGPEKLSGFHMRKIRNIDGSIMIFGNDSSVLDHEKYKWRYENGQDIDASMPGAPVEIKDSNGQLLGAYAGSPTAKPVMTRPMSQILDASAAQREADLIRPAGVPQGSGKYKGGTQVADLTVTMDPYAVAGNGHVDIRVNDGPNYGFFPQKGEKLDQATQKVPGELKTTKTSDYDPNVWSHTIKTTPEQDARVMAIIQHRLKDPGWYNLFQRNCLQFVQEAFRAAGIETRDDDPRPRAWFHDNFRPRGFLDYYPYHSSFP